MEAELPTINRPREGAPLLVWGLVGLITLVAIVLCYLVHQSVRPTNGVHSLPWWVICLCLAAAGRVPVRFHTGRQTQCLDLFGIPMLLGAVFTSPTDLLLATTIATIASKLRRRVALKRVAFNVVNQVAGVGLALLVLQVTRGNASPVSAQGWLGLCASMVTFEIVTNIFVLCVVTMSSSLPGTEYLKNLGIQASIVIPLNCAAGIIAVTTCWSNRWSLLLVAGPALGLAVWYRSANTLRTRFADLQSLYGFTIGLADVSERHDVLGVALEETRAILHCHHTELLIPKKDGTVRFLFDSRGLVVREHFEITDFEAKVLKSKKPALIPRDRTDSSTSGRTFTDLMAVPVAIGDSQTGVLIAADRQGDTSATFQPEDLRLFEALAAHLSTALTSSGRLDQLRHEVAAREHEAHHDNLTGLANRSLFSQVVTAALKQRQPSQLVAVMLMDLDGFKEINDTLGHHTGDSILIEVAARVDAAVGANRLAARLGGDEFAFVVTDIPSLDDIFKLANFVLESVYSPLSVDGIQLTLRASLGIAIAPIHGSDTATLLKRADVAMYTAKSSNRGVTVYEPKIDHYSTRRLVLASEQQRAIEANELEVWFQPVAHLESGDISGFEALMRWRHPEYGAIPPDEFIPVAEQTGLIETLTNFVMRVSLEELRRYRDDGYEFDMAVNVSARNLFDTEIVERLRRTLTETGTAPAALTLEITESSMMLDSERSERILTQLSNLGVKIAIDDFGTGYSSLSRLKVLPVHLVKIDRSFVKHMCTDAGDEAIVRSTIDLARNMGHIVVAEGVEDLATWDRLDELGCDYVQGYFLSAAMPSEQCREWIRSRHLTPTLAPVRALRRFSGTA